MSDIHALSQHLEQVRHEALQLQTELMHMENEVALNNGKTTELEAQLASKRHLLSQKQSEFKQVSSHAEQHKRAADQHKTSPEEIKLEQTIKKDQAEIKKFEAQIAKDRTEIQNATEHLRDLAAQGSADKAAVDRELITEQNKSNTTKLEVQKIEAEIQGIEHLLASQKQQKTTIEHSINALRMSLQSKKSEEARAQIAVNEAVRNSGMKSRI